MSYPFRILVSTTDDSVSAIMHSTIQAEGHHLSVVADPHAALALLNDGQRDGQRWDAMFFDTCRQPPGDRFILEALVRLLGSTRVTAILAPGNNTLKQQLERLDIQQVLQKPLLPHDIDGWLSRMGPSGHCAPPAPTRAEKQPYFLDELPDGRHFLAACPAMLKIYDTLRLLAPVDVPVLILGESGVGKDVIANLLHKHSLRSREGYHSVNCAALPSDLLESELFGYEAGAFTGAVKAKLGRFDLANHGTILLDEIGEMPAPMQAKLLHVLQDGRFCRLGSRTTTQLDVRVIAATNIDIEQAIRDHTFREDLYYRISAFTLTIPPLRERLAELPFLLKEMMKRQALNLHLEPLDITPALLSVMSQHTWPGNLRELSNFVIRMLILQDVNAAIDDLSLKIEQHKRNSSQGIPLSAPLSAEPASMRAIVHTFKGQTESRLIQEALDIAGWNRRRAAVHLGISYRTLLYKIQQYELRQSSRMQWLAR